MQAKHNIMKISVYTDKRGKVNVIRLRFKPKGGDAFMVSTGIECINEPVNCAFPMSEPNAAAKTFRLMKMFTECQDYVLNHDLPAAKMKAELTALITGRPVVKDTIASMFDKFAKEKYEGTRKMYERTSRKVSEFDSKADFESIDKRWLERFHRWLIDNGANANGAAHHLRNLRAVFNYAIEEEVTNNYPFRKFKIRYEQTRKRDLTAEQLRTLRDYPCEPFQQKYVDLFMLMFYLCGINAGDLFLLTKENVNNGRIEYYRQKTKKYYSIKIEPEAQAILDKYQGEKYLLNMMDNNTDYHQPLKRMNQQLKKIGKTYKEGEKWEGDPLFPDISSYYARHTWASIAAEVDVPMDVIAQALGHASPYSTTDIYVNRRLKKIDEANRLILDFLAEKS